MHPTVLHGKKDLKYQLISGVCVHVKARERQKYIYEYKVSPIKPERPHTAHTPVLLHQQVGIRSPPAHSVLYFHM